MSPDSSSRYLTTAFYSQYNLILLAGSALFSLASASPWPAAIGVALELAWLSFGPRSASFRRHVDERAASERRELLDDEVTQGMRELNQAHTARLSALSATVSWIARPVDGQPDDPVEREARLELEALRPAFMRLCQLRERIEQRLEAMRDSPPELEAAELARAYAAEKDLGQRFTLHQAVKAARKRVEQQQRLGDVLRQVDTKLSLLEQSLSQLQQRLQHELGPAELVREVQAVMALVLLVPALEAELDA